MDYTSDLSLKDKTIFVDTLCYLASCDGNFDDGEFLFIESLCLAMEVNPPARKGRKTFERILEDAKDISSIGIAHHLIKEMFFIAHYDGDLSDDEIIAISKIGLSMNMSLEEIQQISEWVIDNLEADIE